ncbi:uncharacterized protein A1O5_01773 [Cladophialophora psammophila CBS 110553]|uniref:Xylanolytic transcriptional activator regulatory domain-containing protein n=1 Tax=Cladophialophora psammophila CBS 110553 TaxID=1182543 RepID=W9X3L4_9EURO|nr:uncharacterized protein A1O5_01773 [Cladophialophora psammophila CBS 110553]EXJ75077.1 hypothetical protein A1O5_01773 [Cladophialophora psammophila CBS 110553]
MPATPTDKSTAPSDSDPQQDAAKLLDSDTSATPYGVQALPDGEVSCEYHGPGAMISICSKSAVTWVCQKAGNADFERITANFASAISRRLKVDLSQLRERIPEPPQAVAWSYCQAYFNSGSGLWFQSLNQAAFEARLASHFRDDSPGIGHDPSWYALRNIVYATGCRSLKSKQVSADSHDMQRQSWSYFCNAMSVYTDLLFSHTGLSSVQALTLMSAFIEGIACPSLEFMLSSSALRLAESKGLHRGLSSTCLEKTTDIQAASHTWWAIYTHHCVIVARSGRSLQIDDNAITCPLPTQHPGDSWSQHATIIAMAKHARILASVIKTLNVIRASRSMSATTFTMIQELDDRLREWRSGFPSFVQMDPLPAGVALPKGVHQEHCLYLVYSYYATLIQIHSIVMSPWNAVYQDSATLDPSLRPQIFRSASIVAEASRKIIAQLRHMTVGLGTLKWAVLVYPMIAMIHLFIYILDNPSLPSVDADISIMHEAAAHFSFLEYRLGKVLSLPFPRDLANLIRVVVADHRESSSLRVTGMECGSFDLEPGFEGQQNDLPELGNLETADWDALIPWEEVLDGLDGCDM